MISLKRSIALFLMLAILFPVLPVSKFSFDQTNADEAKEQCYAFESDGFLLAADISYSVSGVAARQMIDNWQNVYDDVKWVISDDGKLICGELYLCVVGSSLMVSSSKEYAVDVAIADTIGFYFEEKQIYISFDSENSAFVKTEDADTACDFTVYECENMISVMGITLNRTEFSLFKGESFTLCETVYPQNATDKRVYWQSSNTSVAEVTDGVVSAVGEGSAVVSAVTSDGGFCASCTVNVFLKYYTVNFFDIDNTVAKSEQVEEGKGATAPELLHSGYDFLGWNPTDFSCILKDTDIYSLWETLTYTITFDACGGELEYDKIQYTTESDYIIFPIPVKDGYEFEGWFESEKFEGSPISGLETGSYGDKNYYAKWNIITYKITYNVNGGNVPSPVAYFTIESPDIYLPVAQRRGYTFEGWYENANLSGEPVVVIKAGSTGNKVFYAKWQPVFYTITYHFNGGAVSGGYATIYTVENDDIVLPIPKKKGYTFGGWYENAGLMGESCVVISGGSIGNREFYAKWSVIEYSLAFKFNGGVAQGDVPTFYTVESSDIQLPEAKRTGYSFVGWYESESFEGEIISSIKKGSTGNKTFYARWQKVDYTITYHTNGGSFSTAAPYGYTIESEDIVLPIPERCAYTFMGWYESEYFTGSQILKIKSGSYGNKEYYAKWSPVSYSISYETNGGKIVGNIITSYNIESPDIALPDAQKTGYNFCGWYDNADFSGSQVFFVARGSYDNKKYYAKWEPIVYTITYNTNGGAMPMGSHTTYTIESSEIVLKSPIRRGFEFCGWYKNADFTGSEVVKIARGSYGNIELYAKWSIINYTITYVTEGGDIIGDAPGSYNVESGNLNLPANVLRIGYKFCGWYREDDFSGSPVTYIIGGSAGDIVLYAKFTPVQYNITYQLYGGEFSSEPVYAFDIETETFILPVPQRCGYSFCGFYLTPSFTGKAVDKIEKGSVGDITLYASWEIINYGITYYVYDGMMPQEQYATSYNIESDTITLPKPTQTGYVFVGWYDNEAFSGIPVREIEKGSYGDRVFYANWRKLRFKVTFFEADNTTELDVQFIDYGESATCPELIPQPPYEGYYFTGWDKDFSCVTSNLECYPVYELVEYNVVFVDLDYSIIDVQKVKHGYAAVEPQAPEHENCVFVFWSCDFSCVKSDLTVVAVYRATSVTPRPTLGQRFVSKSQFEDGGDYLITVETQSGLYALTSLTRFEDNGLWAMEINKNGNTFSPKDSTKNLADSVFSANGNEALGYTLISEASGERLTYESGDFTMCDVQMQNDLFKYIYEDGAWRLYDETKNVYLSLNEAGGYFVPCKDIESSSKLVLYRRINLPEYAQITTPKEGKIYTIVAQRPDGAAYALAEDGGSIVSIPVDIVDGKLYFNENIDEKTTAFRAVYGENAKGISYRNAGNSMYLGFDGTALAFTKNSNFYWSYTINDISGETSLAETNRRKYLFCNENGVFSAQSEITHSKIIMFERKPLPGKKGDVNLDGVINTGDATMLLKYVAGLNELYDDQLYLSDANGSGDVNTGDVVAILRFAVGLVDWLG